MIAMTGAEIVAALFGGALVGLGVALLMICNGRIAGISGVLGDALQPTGHDKGWRFAFLVGLVIAPLLSGVTGEVLRTPAITGNWGAILIGGALVGFGTRLGNGCTAGHGLCGMARLSVRSLAATAIFMLTAIATVFITHHVWS
jgi:uncharacterized membrane protein YedE/YeeE